MSGEGSDLAPSASIHTAGAFKRNLRGDRLSDNDRDRGPTLHREPLIAGRLTTGELGRARANHR
jgi:hypothetical protein